MTTETMLFALLRNVTGVEAIKEEIKNACIPEKLEEIYALAKKHDLAHLVGQAISNLGLSKSVAFTKCKCAAGQAVYRYEQLQYTFDKLCDALENAQIPFLPLKGSVIRKHYPEPWMRTSCDIDVLVREADLERAMAVLTEQYSYEYHEKGSHDVSLYAPGKIHVELHYDLVEDFIGFTIPDVLKNVWDTVTVKEPYAFWCEMPDELFYLYHVAHMAKHFKNGGCGIRPFMDLWILDKLQGADREKRDRLLKQGELLKFTNAARKLSWVWFANEEHDPISRQMEDYILRGGVYGNIQNRIVMQQQQKGGRLRYLLSKVFLSYDIIKFHYPILQKHRWLTPVMEVRRWFKLIFCGHLKRATREIQYNHQITREEAANAKEFLENIGL